jgi:hypothetical protein
MNWNRYSIDNTPDSFKLTYWIMDDGVSLITYRICVSGIYHKQNHELEFLPKLIEGNKSILDASDLIKRKAFWSYPIDLL